MTIRVQTRKEVRQRRTSPSWEGGGGFLTFSSCSSPQRRCLRRLAWLPRTRLRPKSSRLALESGRGRSLGARPHPWSLSVPTPSAAAPAGLSWGWGRVRPSPWRLSGGSPRRVAGSGACGPGRGKPPAEQDLAGPVTGASHCHRAAPLVPAQFLSALLRAPPHTHTQEVEREKAVLEEPQEDDNLPPKKNKLLSQIYPLP